MRPRTRWERFTAWVFDHTGVQALRVSSWRGKRPFVKVARYPGETIVIIGSVRFAHIARRFRR